MPWQNRALFYTDAIPELNYASNFYARMLQKLRIYPAFRVDDDTVEAIETGPPVEAMNRIQDPGGGRTGILGMYGKLAFITGEGYLFGRGIGLGRERWSYVWREELRFDDAGFVTHVAAPQLPYENFTLKESDWEELPPGSALAYRMWTPHPRFSHWPSSPMLAVQQEAEELLVLSSSVLATATSRLVRAPLLAIPEEIAPTPPTTEGDEAPLTDPFLSDFTEHLTRGINAPADPASLAPYVLYAGAEWIEKIKTLYLHDPQTDYLERDLRTECIRRISRGLDLPPEVIEGMSGTNHWCMDSDTEILSERGWVRHGDLTESDVVLTLNHETGLSEWQPVLDVYRAEVVDEPMLQITGKGHSSLSTMQHRWPVLTRVLPDDSRERGWETSATLDSRDQIVRAAPSADIPIERTWSDAHVELMAWLWTEGRIEHRPGRKKPRVAIYQSHEANQGHVDSIRCALRDRFGEATVGSMPSSRRGVGDGQERWRELRGDGGMTTFVLNAAASDPLAVLAPDRCVALDFIRELTLSQLHLFIDTSVKADGRKMSSSTLQITQSDPRRLDAVELAAILAGYATNRYSSQHQGFRWHTIHSLSIGTRTVFGPKEKHKQIVNHTGTVWCPTTKNSTWLARRHGSVFYTGNSAWWISDDMWRSHGAPIAEQFCDNLSEAYLRPALEEAGFERWEEVVVAYDASAVVVNPDRSKDADQAFDRGAIGYKAYRQAKNFKDEDAQSDEEHMEFLAIKKVILDEEGNPIPASGGGGDVTQEDKVASGDEPGAPDGEPGDVSEGTNLPASAAKFQGAAEMALLRCRELAGSRIRSRRKSCPHCLDEVAHLPNTLVASGLGRVGLEPLGGPDPRELVAGGSEAFKALLLTWSYDEREADAVCGFLELHAARTLFHEHPAIPNFHAVAA